VGKKVELALSILNGVVGDHLARTGNGLALRLELIHGGASLACTREALAAAHPAATGKVVVLIHGLMTTESIWELATGGDYGSLLAADLGFTPLYVRYNTGVAIADNGAALAALLGELVAAYPVPIEEILLLGYSMGGLVARTACHLAREADMPWLAHVKRAIYIGTPHRGAPLERVGRTVTRLLRSIDDPYTRLFADLGNLRSTGIKDLGDADSRDLLPEIQHYLIAGSLVDGKLASTLFGDGIVPVPSATNDLVRAALPPDHVAILPGVGHLAIARHPAVYERIRAWLTPASPMEVAT
jgi:pimeloyl-ACP methyl ester carboxylesterase